MLNRISIVIFTLGFIFLNTNSVFSEEPQEWSPYSVGPVIGWRAMVCGKRKLAVQPYFFYNRVRGVFDGEGNSNSLPEGDKNYQYQEDLFFQYGVTKRFEASLYLDYQQNYIKQGDLKAHSNGIGDTDLFLRYCFTEEKGWLPYITGLFRLGMPTGKYQHADPNKLGTDLMGNGSWDPGCGLIMTKKLKPFMISADASYAFPQRVKIDDVKTKYNTYSRYNFEVEYFLPKGFNLMFELNGFLQGDTKQDSIRTPSSSTKYLIVSPSIGWSNSKIQTLLAYQRVVVGTNVDAADSAVFTFVYTF